MTTGRAPLTPRKSRRRASELAELVRDGIVEIDDDELRVTGAGQAVHPQRRRVLRHLPASAAKEGPVYSRGDMRPGRGSIGARHLSGLAAAWHLADRGFAVTVIDRASRPGGLINTIDRPNTASLKPAPTRSSGTRSWQRGSGASISRRCFL